MQLIKAKLKRSGLEAIANFLINYHKDPEHALEYIKEWAREAEFQIEEGRERAFLEIGKFYSTNQVPNTLSINKDLFEIEIEEIE